MRNQLPLLPLTTSKTEQSRLTAGIALSSGALVIGRWEQGSRCTAGIALSSGALVIGCWEQGSRCRDRRSRPVDTVWSAAGLRQRWDAGDWGVYLCMGKAGSVDRQLGH